MIRTEPQDAPAEPAQLPVVRAGLYCRLSLDHHHTGVKVARQEQELRALCAHRGWEVGEVYIDNDRSAFDRKSKRPDFERMLRDIRAGRITALTSWASDRLVRRRDDYDRLVRATESAGTGIDSRIATVTGYMDLSTPHGRMQGGVAVEMSQYESAQKGERQRAANRHRRLAGEQTVGARPYGYERGGKVIRPEEAAIIREAAERFLSGVGLAGICNDLNRRGVPTGRPEYIRTKQPLNGSENGTWRTPALRSILLNPRNAGILHYDRMMVVPGSATEQNPDGRRTIKREIVGPGNWPAIISEEMFEAVKAKLEDPRRRISPGPNPKWLGTTIYRCGACGYAMSAHHKNGHPSYRCRNAGCRQVVRKLEPVDDFVVKAVVSKLREPDAVNMLVKPQEGPDPADLHAERESLRQKRDSLTRLFVDGKIDERQLAVGTQETDTRIKELDRLMETVSGTDPLGLLQPAIGHPEVMEKWKALGLAAQRAILGALVEVHIMPSGKIGRRRFDPSKEILITWKRGKDAGVQVRPTATGPDEVDRIREYVERRGGRVLRSDLFKGLHRVTAAQLNNILMEYQLRYPGTVTVVRPGPKGGVPTTWISAPAA